MITRVEFASTIGEVLALPLGGEYENCRIENIDGLDPVKSTIVSSSFGQRAGSQFQSSRREERNLVFTFGLEPDTMSVRAIRDALYKVLMPESNVRIRFYFEDESYVVISGRVETFECPLFVQDPKATISIICFDPDFVSATSIVVDSGTVNADGELLINYPGSIPTGVYVRLEVDQPLSGFIIKNRHPGAGYQELEFIGNLNAGDTVIMSTVSGNKYARKFEPDGYESSVLYGVSPSATWVNLLPGENYIRLDLSSGSVFYYTIEYTARYGGL